VKFKDLRKTTNKTIFPFVVCFLLFFSCGIEDYPYLYPVPAGNIRRELNTKVEIQIPDDNSTNNYFTHFVIYYKIYISDASDAIVEIPSTSNFFIINSTLASDYNQISPYISNSSMGGSSIPNLFRNRNYYPLKLENGDIDLILSNSVLNRKLIINFGSNRNPYLVLDVDSGTGGNDLLRNSSAGFQLMPDGYFVNSNDIRNPNYINAANINNDVADKPNASPSNSYVAMFIVATGFDSRTYAGLYSSPNFVGVFKLPDNL
jgi:hypothetical protein